MSFLQKVQAKFSSVTGDLNQKLFPPKTSDELPYDPVIASSFQGASYLLDNYQKTWSAIREDNIAISKRAELVDFALGRIYNRVKLSHQQLEELCRELATLPKLQALVNDMEKRVDNLHLLCQSTEIALAQLQDQLEHEQQVIKEREILANLLVYKCSRAEEIDKLRARLAQEHVDRLAQNEAKSQMTLAERQATFQIEFERDIEHYREHGCLPKRKDSRSMSISNNDSVLHNSEYNENEIDENLLIPEQDVESELKLEQFLQDVGDSEILTQPPHVEQQSISSSDEDGV